MKRSVSLAPECRIASEREEYAELHKRCAGTEAVKAGGYAPFVVQRCDCPCHSPSQKKASPKYHL